MSEVARTQGLRWSVAGVELGGWAGTRSERTLTVLPRVDLTL